MDGILNLNQICHIVTKKLSYATKHSDIYNFIVLKAVYRHFIKIYQRNRVCQASLQSSNNSFTGKELEAIKLNN